MSLSFKQLQAMFNQPKSAESAGKLPPTVKSKPVSRHTLQEQRGSMYPSSNENHSFVQKKSSQSIPQAAHRQKPQNDNRVAPTAKENTISKGQDSVQERVMSIKQRAHLIQQRLKQAQQQQKKAQTISIKKVTQNIRTTNKEEMAQESPQKQATSPKQEENTEKILSASEAKKRFEELMKSQRPMRPLVPVLKPTAQVSIFTNSLKGVQQTDEKQKKVVQKEASNNQIRNTTEISCGSLEHHSIVSNIDHKQSRASNQLPTVRLKKTKQSLVFYDSD